jgi:predicted nucleic acid-binding protein
VILAALAIEHGLTLWPSDADFGTFAGLKWNNPLAANR